MSEQEIEMNEKERKGMNKRRKMYERGEREKGEMNGEKEKMSIREIGRQRTNKRNRERGRQRDEWEKRIKIKTINA